MRIITIITFCLFSLCLTSTAQNVGVGTNSPEKELDLRGTLQIKRSSSSINPHIDINGSDAGDGFGRLKFSSEALSTDHYWLFAGRSLESHDASSRFNLFYSGDATTGNLFSVLGNGKFGINTTPSDRFHVVSSVGEHPMRIVIGGSTKLRVLSNGGTTIGLNNTAGTPTDGLFVHGNTGLGVSNPTDKLAVAGDVDINGTAKIDQMALGQSTVHNSAIIDMSSITKGVLIPRMKTSQRDLIASPAEGLMIFNTISKQFNVYKDAAWETLNGELAGDGESNVKLDQGTEEGVFFYKSSTEHARLLYKTSDLPVLEFKNSMGNTLIGEDVADGLTPAGAFGIDNVFVGQSAGRYSLSTSHSVYLGKEAGQSNEDGARNIFIGESAGKLRQSSSDNIFIGHNAGNINVNKSNNIYVGNDAGSATSGEENVFLGNNTMGIGDRNVYAGFEAAGDSGGNDNVMVGWRAGKNNSQYQNTIIGGSAGELAPAMYQNVMIGYEAGKGIPVPNTVAVNASTIVGFQAGKSNEDDYNTFIGYRAGATHQLGNRCVFIGSEAGENLQGPNHLVIEANSTSNGLIFGNFNTREVAINWATNSAIPNTFSVNGTASKSTAGSWLANSDARLKTNIVEMDRQQMLDKVLSMRGVTYEWNDDKTGIERPNGIQSGFIAQDIQKVWPEKVQEDANGYLQTAYGDYDPMFVESIKALNDKIEKQEQLINQLIEEVRELRGRSVKDKSKTAGYTNPIESKD